MLLHKADPWHINNTDGLQVKKLKWTISTFDTITQQTDIIETKKKKALPQHNSPTKLRKLINAHGFHKQYVTSDTGNHHHEWVCITPHSDFLEINNMVVGEYNYQPNHPTHFHSMSASYKLRRAPYQELKQQHSTKIFHTISIPSQQPWFAPFNLEVAHNSLCPNQQKIQPHNTALPQPMCAKRYRSEHKFVRRTTNHLRHWTSSSRQQCTMSVPKNTKKYSWHNDKNWFEALQTVNPITLQRVIKQRNENAATSPHHTTATTATEMCLSITPLKFTRRTTCHLWHWTSSSRKPSPCTQRCVHHPLNRAPCLCPKNTTEPRG